MSMCPMCMTGMPSSCLTGSCDSTTTEEIPVTPSLTLLGIEITNLPEGENNGEDKELQDEGRGRSSRGRGRSNSRRHASDSQSSGRKEAAKLFPLDEEASCEWQGKADCGGGDYPILGCLQGKQQARHHGPDKSTQNNTEGNVHRICHYCHNRWHAKNDETYDWNAGIWPPHNPRPLTESEKTFVTVDYMRYLKSGKRQKEKVLD